MIFRKQFGWIVAMAYVLSGVRRRIVRRVRHEGLIVPVLFHGPTPKQLEAILGALDRLVGVARLEVTFDDGRRVLKDCLPVLEKYGVKSVFFISPGEILLGYNKAEASREPLLSVDDIRELARHPLVEFGNHTWNHVSAERVSGEVVLDEIARTQRQIAEWTGVMPTKFSYPFGHDKPELDAPIRAMGLTPYCLKAGLIKPGEEGRARNMAYEDMTVAENVGRLLTAWPKVRRMPV